VSFKNVKSKNKRKQMSCSAEMLQKIEQNALEISEKLEMFP